jgi:pyridoxal phosphate enzyme (YggS family)
MTENLSTEISQKIEWFDRNFEDINRRIALACEQVGKKPSDIIMLAATKTVPVEVINHAIKSGVKYIGENRVQEFLSKKEQLLPDAHRHFIGHLQTNKVKDIVGEVEMIESVHSLKLATEINRLCEKLNKTMDILLEVNIGDEESKSGFSPEELEDNLLKISKLPFIKVKGLMTIPPICDNNEKSMQYFELDFVQNGELRVINGVNFEFFSVKHPVTCLGFKASSNGKNFVYSGDTDLCDSLEEKIKTADLVLADGAFLSEQYKEGSPHMSAKICSSLSKNTG